MTTCLTIGRYKKRHIYLLIIKKLENRTTCGMSDNTNVSGNQLTPHNNIKKFLIMDNTEKKLMTEKLEGYLQLSEDEQLLQLGKVSPNYYSSIGAKPLNPKQIIEIAKKWFNELILKIQPLICPNENVIKFARKSKSIEDLHLGILIIELIYPVFGPLHTPLIVSIVLTKGINLVCENYKGINE